MKTHVTIKALAAGAAGGLVNGLLGAGAGLILVPAFTALAGLEKRGALAASVLTVAPLCAVSAVVYHIRGELDLSQAAPYLAGGFFGGWLGSSLFGKVPITWLSRGLAAFMLYGGLKYLGLFG